LVSEWRKPSPPADTLIQFITILDLNDVKKYFFGVLQYSGKVQRKDSRRSLVGQQCTIALAMADRVIGLGTMVTR